MASRLPTPGGDDGTWGNILNDYLSQAHHPDGTLKPIVQSDVQDLTNDLSAKLNTDDLDISMTALVNDAGSSTGGALAATYATTGPRAINVVQQFGVVPNQVANQRVAIQAALDAAAAAGAVLEFPPGVYYANQLVMNTLTKIRGVGADSTRLGGGGRYAGVTLRQISGAPDTVLKIAGAGCSIENILIDGNGAPGTLLEVAEEEARLRTVRLYNGTGLGLLISLADNGYMEDVSVDNCGSSTLPAVQIQSTAPSTTNTLNLTGLQIERSANRALDIAYGSDWQTNYAEFLRIVNLHIEAPADNGGTQNASSLVRIGNIRNVDFVAPFIYGGAGALVSHEYNPSATRGNIDGGVRFLGGTLLGRKSDIGGTPDYLVQLVTGNSVAFIGTEFDMCNIAAIVVGSGYGSNVYIDPSCVFTSRVPAAIFDNRTTPSISTFQGDVKATRDVVVTRHLLTSEGAGRTFSVTSGLTAVTNSSAAQDRKGNVTFGTTASPPAAGELFRMNFAAAYAAAPQAVIGPRSAAAQALGLYAKCTTTQLIVYCTAAPAASQANTTYDLSYIVES